MTNQYKELYRNGVRNAEISASGSEYFITDVADREARYKHGSFNTLVILQSGNTSYRIKLDGRDEAGYSFDIPSTGSFVIKPEEGIFFDWFIIENLDSVNAIAEDAISCRWGISKSG